MDIYAKYRQFLREYVDKKYLQHYKNVTVLGENFVDNYYVVLFETQEDSLYHPMPEMRRFILVENIEKPILSKLIPQPDKKGYITMKKSELKGIVGNRLYNKFANQGIATTKEIGLRTNKRFCWHRLIACLYYNCIDKQIHHINRHISDNSINNLVPLKESTHKKIDNFDFNGNFLSIDYQEHEKYKIRRTKRTIAKDDDVIMDIIHFSLNGHKIKTIINKKKRILKKSSIYKIVKIIYYKKEFLNWLQNQQEPAWEQLDGKFNNRWCEIIKFEKL